MAKKNKEVKEDMILEVKETGVENNDEGIEIQKQLKQLRYVGKTINHFSHGGQLYQLIPNTVYLDLPDCEQVKTLIKRGELVEV